jgi:hypothetical protein
MDWIINIVVILYLSLVINVQSMICSNPSVPFNTESEDEVRAFIQSNIENCQMPYAGCDASEEEGRGMPRYKAFFGKKGERFGVESEYIVDGIAWKGYNEIARKSVVAFNLGCFLEVEIISINFVESFSYSVTTRHRTKFKHSPIFFSKPFDAISTEKITFFADGKIKKIIRDTRMEGEGIGLSSAGAMVQKAAAATQGIANAVGVMDNPDFIVAGYEINAIAFIFFSVLTLFTLFIAITVCIILFQVKAKYSFKYQPVKQVLSDA